MAADNMFSRYSTCLCLWTNMQSCNNVLITGLKETADVLSADAVADVTDHAADSTLDVVDEVIDEAHTAIDFAGNTSDILLFGVGTKSLTMFGLKILPTVM